MDLVGRSLEAPEGSFFLFGPRGTGKSTWVRQRFPRAVRVDLLDEGVLREMTARPERLLEMVRTAPAGSTFFLDEIQRAPSLLPGVHLLIEERRAARFVMTGSSVRKIRRPGVDLLGGRAVLSHMHPFMAAELGDRFRLDEALRIGTLPVVRAAPRPAEALRTYVGFYLREEVQMEGLVRRVEDFARFLEVAALSHASSLNVSNVARECAVGRKAAEAYVRIAEDMLLAFRLDVFRRRAKRALAAHPKLYLFDAGVFRSLRPAGPLDRPGEIDGQALEGLVAQHLRAWIDYRGRKNSLHYWRTRAGSEVDFVVYGEDGLWAIEVKNAGRDRPEDLRGLKSFLDEYPMAKAVLLHRGDARALVEKRILVEPCEGFLRRLDPGKDLEGVVVWP
jgi:predicted AAA+ superfamily ATPase